MTALSLRARFALPIPIAAALVLAAGCQNDAGLTNGPPPSSSGAKAADRTDLPAPPVAEQHETAGRVENTGNDAGSAGRGGGDNPSIPKDTSDTVVRGAPTKDDSSPASPAGGGNKPADDTKSGARMAAVTSIDPIEKPSARAPGQDQSSISP